MKAFEFFKKLYDDAAELPPKYWGFFDTYHQKARRMVDGGWRNDIDNPGDLEINGIPIRGYENTQYRLPNTKQHVIWLATRLEITGLHWGHYCYMPVWMDCNNYRGDYEILVKPKAGSPYHFLRPGRFSGKWDWFVLVGDKLFSLETLDGRKAHHITPEKIIKRVAEGEIDELVTEEFISTCKKLYNKL